MTGAPRKGKKACSEPDEGNIRNLAMEKVAGTVMFPCKYSTTGCNVSVLHTEKGEHEDTCEFRPYSCPCPGASCKWQGSLESVMPHLMMSHKSITTLQGPRKKLTADEKPDSIDNEEISEIEI
ncbi:Uncharacterized protein GBIM_00998 [Gryllus bimaculatus]|nr:Uncharacterized protein GBIM_00998 [Gryllus bimaculatus]